MIEDQPTVFIIDDNAPIRDALSLLISLKGLRTRVFARAEDFLGAVPTRAAGCVLMDLKMPGLSGAELQTILRQRRSLLPIVVLTAHGTVANARAAFKNGAFDFLEKPVDDDLLIEVIRDAVRARQQHDAAADTNVTARLNRLSPRELEVLRLLAQGFMLREIGLKLGISPRTVEVHKARAMAKLHCNTLADIIRVSIETGLVGQHSE